MSDPPRTVPPAVLYWRIAIDLYQHTHDKSAIDRLLQAGVPVPDFARELLLANLKRTRPGARRKVDDHRIVRAVCNAIIQGAGNCNAQGDNEAHRRVAEKFGISASTVKKAWNRTPREFREAIRDDLLRWREPPSDDGFLDH